MCLIQIIHISFSFLSLCTRAGADDIISFSNDNFTQNFFDKSIAQSNLINELTSRESYDAIFITTKVQYNIDFLHKFLKTNGKLVDSVEPELPSDEYGVFKKLCFSVRSFQVSMIVKYS